jgi:hypothetical protein
MESLLGQIFPGIIPMAKSIISNPFVEKTPSKALPPQIDRAERSKFPWIGDLKGAGSEKPHCEIFRQQYQKWGARWQEGEFYRIWI